MYFKFGNYTHAQNEVRLDRISRSAQRGQSGAAGVFTEQWQLSGQIYGADDAALKAAMLALESAYSFSDDAKTAVLLLDDNTTETAHELTNALVSSFEWAPGDGAELTTYRSYSITLESETSLPVGLVDYNETIQFTGTGGPEVAWVEILNGPPQPQIIRQQTLCVAVQSGSLISGQPGASTPAPMFPQLELLKQRTVTYGTPKKTQSGFGEYPVSWSYQFASGQPFFGRPSWPQ